MVSQELINPMIPSVLKWRFKNLCNLMFPHFAFVIYKEAIFMPYSKSLTMNRLDGIKMKQPE